MKKFKFRLQKVLEYRTVLKQEKLRELAIKNQALNDANNLLTSLEAAYRENEVSQLRLLSSQSVLLSGVYGERIKDEIVSERLNIIRAEEEVQKAREAYIEATKESETLETLKKKKKEEHRQAVEKADLNFLDELSVMRGNRFN
jgi:flagellar FliJ protein